MTRKSLFAIGLVATTALAAAAYADAGHGRNAAEGKDEWKQQAGPGMMGGMMGGQPGDRDDMMRMMMRMHGQTMGGGMMGGMGPAGGMMGGIESMMQAFDADGDGNVTPEELRAGLEARLAKYDADGGGSLSLGEFEALHSAMIRETMVDRFQALDNDGDGQITKEEMTAPANRMETMQRMRDRLTGDAPTQQPGGQGAQRGQMPMMDNN